MNDVSDDRRFNFVTRGISTGYLHPLYIYRRKCQGVTSKHSHKCRKARPQGVESSSCLKTAPSLINPVVESSSETGRPLFSRPPRIFSEFVPPISRISVI